MTTKNDGCKGYLSGEALEAYRRVKIDRSATEPTVIYADAEDDYIGTTGHAVDAAGRHVSVKHRKTGGTRMVVAAGAFALFDRLFAAADGKVDDDPDGHGTALIALQAAGADLDIVEAVEIDTGPLVYAARADSAHVEDTTTETAFDKSKTIDGAALEVGDVLEIVAQAFVEDNNSTDTLNLKLKVGTEEIVATGAVDVADNDVGFIHAFVTIRAVGAGGALQACGVVGLGVPGTVTAKPFRKAQASEDLSGDVAITVTATWSVAHADNEVEIESLIVKHHKL